MKLKLMLTFILFLLPTLGWSGAPTSRVIVKFKPSTDARASINALQSTLNASSNAVPLSLTNVKKTPDGAMVLSLGETKTESELRAVINTIRKDPDIEYAEPDLLMQPMMTPNDSRYSEQWDFFETAGGMRMEEAWETATGEGVVVAVIDTGYRPHEDLVGNILPGYDFISDPEMGNDGDGRDNDARDPGDAVESGECGPDSPPQDIQSSWHGTHVAGTVAAVTNNNKGVAGIAFDAKVVPIRVLGKCGGYTSDIADAIYWAAGLPVAGVPNNPNPAQVINMSLGSNSPSTCLNTYSNAIEAARNAGAVVVIASGNSSKNANDFSPGNCENALTIAATNRDGGKSFYSNTGTVIDVAAPGGAQSFANDPNGILSTLNTGIHGPEEDNYAFFQGTSMAAPHVAGLAALLFSLGGLNVEDVENIIINTTRPFPAKCDDCGTGIVDASVAVTALGKANLSVAIIEDKNNSEKTNAAYIVRVTNNGFARADNIELTHTLPEGSALTTSSPSQGSCDLEALTCDLGNLNQGDSIDVNVVANLTDKDQLFVAEVTGDSTEFSLTDNRAEARFGGALIYGALIAFALTLRRRLLASVSI